MTIRPVDRQATSRLQALKDSLGSWRKVAAYLGVNVGECHHVWAGKRRANAALLKALNLVKPRKPRLTISMSRTQAVELMAVDVPDWAYQMIDNAVRKYDKRSASA